MKFSAVAFAALSVLATSAESGNDPPSLVRRMLDNNVDRASRSSSPLQRRADECEYTIIKDGDLCDTLAERCGVKLSDFIKYNSGDSDDDAFCDDLHPTDPICCSEGDLPDLRPQPDDDGYCAVHEIGPDDLCDTLETKYHLGPDDLEDFNKGKTWGWAGCGRLQKKMKICVSKGKPPMPAEDERAICGPQVPGTKPPTNDTEIADLNPCPLNVCCNIWGQCGTTEEYCIDTSIDDTPGTAKNGTNGCISNCGMDIVNNDDPPKEYSRIAYFEAWNHERECLHMDVTNIKSPYTHIHFAFGDISADDYVPSGNGVEEQFKKFREMKGSDVPKRIISFGGWAFSNEPGTNHIIRSGVKEENRKMFAENVIKFIEDNDLDGVDFDWEYPGAEDIPGSEPGSPEDGPNYLEFLKLVRDGLPDDKSLSIAAPASYWYLRNFPIKDIAKVVDYIVYMAYDLHGQWDVGNQWATPGCPEGNCLRSHVNLTETMNSLAMITKAGVKSNQIMVGVSSYGRSFKMSDSGCSGPNCNYEGKRNESPAKKGECTDTGGYIADAEIYKIMELGEEEWTMRYDEDSDSNILVYDRVEWVGFMNSTVKDDRIARYKKLNFAGVSDWAVDLQQDYSEDDGEIVYVDDNVFEGHEMDCNPPCTFVLPPSKLPEKTTITIPPYTTTVEISGDKVTTTTITITPEPITTDSISFYNIPVTSGDNASMIQPYPSLTLERPELPLTYIVDGETKTTTKTLILPPWPMITNGPPEDWDNSTWPPTTSSDDGDAPSTDLEPDPTLTHITLTGPVPTWESWWDIPVTTRPISEKPDEPEIEEPDPDDPESHRKVKVPCDLWFFDSCVPELDINGWEWIIPPGIIPPGPPPPEIFGPPPGWTVGPVPPPWPRITIGGDGKPSPFPDKPEPCETEVASLCSATTSYDVTDDGTTTRTTSTSTGETCYPIVGCQVEDDDDATTTEDVTCIPSYTAHNKRDLPATNIHTVPTATADAATTADSQEEDTNGEEASLEKRQGQVLSWFPPSNQNKPRAWRNDAKKLKKSCKKENVIVYCTDPYKCDTLADRLGRLNKPDEGLLHVTRIWMERAGYSFTAFFWVDGMSTELKGNLLDMDQCHTIYDPILWVLNYAADELEFIEKPALAQRDPRVDTKWAEARMSIPRDVKNWWTHPDLSGDNKAITDTSKDWKHYLHESAGQGQYVYVIDDCIAYKDSEGRLPEFDGVNIVTLAKPGETYGPGLRTDCSHGTMVASLIGGKTFGMAPKVNLIPVGFGQPVKGSPYFERILEALLRVLDDLEAHPGRGKTTVINMSLAVPIFGTASQYQTIMLELFKKIVSHGAMFVAGAGNRPSRLASEFMPGAFLANAEVKNNIAIVGAINMEGVKSDFSQVFIEEDNVGNIIYAPGEKVEGPPWTRGGPVQVKQGTSFATPLVAGVVAYWRGLPLNDWLAERVLDPSYVKKMLNMFRRSLTDGEMPAELLERSLWSGQVLEDNCLLNRNIELRNPEDKDNPFRPCAKLDRLLQAMRVPCGSGENAKRDGECALPGSPPGDIPLPSSITWGEGDPYPTCTDNCGTLCEGYYCDPTPTGEPPVWAGPTSTHTTSTSSTTTKTTTTTEEPDPTEDPDPPPPCIMIDLKLYRTSFSSESYGTSSLKVDGVEKCDSKATMDFMEIDGVQQRAYKFDCDDGYELIGRINAYWTEADVFFSTPDIDNKNVDLNDEGGEDSIECDLDDDCEQSWWTNPGGCLDL
ncbi:hypothetical protein BJX65DRAFT_301926 [Aspergillus insuetus]